MEKKIVLGMYLVFIIALGMGMAGCEAIGPSDTTTTARATTTTAASTTTTAASTTTTAAGTTTTSSTSTSSPTSTTTTSTSTTTTLGGAISGKVKFSTSGLDVGNSNNNLIAKLTIGTLETYQPADYAAAFNFPGLAPGSYAVSATKEGYLIDPQPVSVTSSAIDVELTAESTSWDYITSESTGVVYFSLNDVTSIESANAYTGLLVAVGASDYSEALLLVSDDGGASWNDLPAYSPTTEVLVDVSDGNGLVVADRFGYKYRSTAMSGGAPVWTNLGKMGITFEVSAIDFSGPSNLIAISSSPTLLYKISSGITTDLTPAIGASEYAYLTDCKYGSSTAEIYVLGTDMGAPLAKKSTNGGNSFVSMGSPIDGGPLFMTNMSLAIRGANGIILSGLYGSPAVFSTTNSGSNWNLEMTDCPLSVYGGVYIPSTGLANSFAVGDGKAILKRK